MSKIVTLTTDFGLQDGYVAAMKGVILSLAPDVKLVDITHLVPPQGIREAAFVLKTTVPYFPRGTIHLVVVDPGVGSPRRAIAVEAAGSFFVAPDNGVLGYVLEDAGEFLVIHLTNSSYWSKDLSSTFHGRDIFAPVAASLATGVSLEELGSPISNPVMLKWPPTRTDESGCIHGEIVYVDRFGNLVSNVPIEPLRGGKWSVQAGGREIGYLEITYSAVQRGEPIALQGSHGFVEVAVREGNASKVLKLGVGGRIVVCPAG